MTASLKYISEMQIYWPYKLNWRQYANSCESSVNRLAEAVIFKRYICHYDQVLNHENVGQG